LPVDVNEVDKILEAVNCSKTGTGCSTFDEKMRLIL
jgi:hypothetical protein